MNRLSRLAGQVDRLPSWAVLAFSLLFIPLIAVADQATGNEIAFSTFYLIPVSLSSWFVGRRSGTAVALLSAAAWTAVDAAWGPGYSRAFIPFWNGAVHLVFFLVITDLLVRLRRHVELEKMNARTDPLTGCLNPRGFAERAEMVFGQARRNGRPLTLAFLDLDGFKAVNDRSGHGEGDRLLRTLGESLVWNLRSYDLAARKGGDEFLLLLPETGFEGAAAFMDSLRGRVSKLFSGNGWPVTMSVGMITFTELPAGLDQAVAMADALMYRSKEEGKDRVVHRSYP